MIIYHKAGARRMEQLCLDVLVTRVLHIHPSASMGKAVYQKALMMFGWAGSRLTSKLCIWASLVGCCLCFVPLKKWRQGWTQAFPLQLHPSPHGCGQPGAVPGWPVHPVSFSALGVQPGWEQWPPITTETASAQAKEGPHHAAECLLWGCERLPMGCSQGVIDWRLATGKEETGLLSYWCTDFWFWVPYGSIATLIYF